MNDGVTGSTPARSGRGLAVLAMLLALVAIGLAVYPYYQQSFGGASSVSARLAAEQTALNQLQQSLDDAKSAFDARLEQQQSVLDKQFAEQNAHVAALLADITGSEATAAGAARMMRVLGLSEAEYLTQAAARQLALRDDGRAIALLKAARQALAGIDAPADVEDSMREALSALEAQPAIDVDALFLKIQSLAQQLPEALPMHGYVAHQAPEAPKSPAPEAPKSPAEAPKSPAEAPKSPAGAPKSLWQSAVTKFLSLFEFHRWDKGGEAPLDVANALELRLNVELLLRTAQVALLRHDEQVYRDSLAGARKLLEQYRGPAAESATAAIAEIDQLSVLPLTHTPPDLSSLLRQLHAAVGGETPQPVPTAAPEVPKAAAPEVPKTAAPEVPRSAIEPSQATSTPPEQPSDTAAATAPAGPEPSNQPASNGAPQ